MGMVQINEHIGQALSCEGGTAKSADFQLAAVAATKRCFGISVAETLGAGNVSAWRFYVGVSAAGTFICRISVTANESKFIPIGGVQGIECAAGIFAERVSGTADVSATTNDGS